MTKIWRSHPFKNSKVKWENLREDEGGVNLREPWWEGRRVEGLGKNLGIEGTVNSREERRVDHGEELPRGGLVCAGVWS